MTVVSLKELSDRLGFISESHKHLVYVSVIVVSVIIPVKIMCICFKFIAFIYFQSKCIYN